LEQGEGGLTEVASWNLRGGAEESTENHGITAVTDKVRSEHLNGTASPICSLNLNCWVLHPVARVSTNAFLKTAVRNNVSVLDFIVHYLLHVSTPIGGHLQVKCTQNMLR
jgi:hypothetical protein